MILRVGPAAELHGAALTSRGGDVQRVTGVPAARAINAGRHLGGFFGLDEVPAALDLARKSAGPTRIVVHPNGDIA